MSQNGAEVRSVLPLLGFAQIRQHLRIDSIGAADQTRQQPAAAGNGAQLLQLVSRFVEFALHDAQTKILLVEDRPSPKLVHFFFTVPDVLDELGLLVRVHRELSGGGTRIDGQHSKISGWQKSPPAQWNSIYRLRSPPATGSAPVPLRPQ